MLRTLAAYLATVLPPLRGERRRWLGPAEAIPDPALREQALGALLGKAANVDAVGVFATLAPPARRRQVIAAIASLQIAIDFLDGLTEAGGMELTERLRLHAPLAGALAPPGEAEGAGAAAAGDGGYLAALIGACREAASGLPGGPAVLPLAQIAVQRCAEGQSYTHAAAAGEREGLERWARALEQPPGYRWWEVAAGASSSVAAHALIAAAADPAIDRPTALAIDAAYYPPIGALTVLLDDLVDRQADRAAGEHNYLAYYEDSEEAAERLGMTAGRAAALVERLPHAARHRAILAGVAGFYLSAPEASDPSARPIRNRLLAELGPPARLLASFSRLCRLGKRKRPGRAGNPPGP